MPPLDPPTLHMLTLVLTATHPPGNTATCPPADTLCPTHLAVYWTGVVEYVQEPVIGELPQPPDALECDRLQASADRDPVPEGGSELVSSHFAAPCIYVVYTMTYTYIHILLVLTR